jgi:hypothetical protein
MIKNKQILISKRPKHHEVKLAHLQIKLRKDSKIDLLIIKANTA